MIYFHLGSHSRKLAFLLIVIQETGFLYLASAGRGWNQETEATIACFKYNWGYKVRLQCSTQFLILCSQYLRRAAHICTPRPTDLIISRTKCCCSIWHLEGRHNKRGREAYGQNRHVFFSFGERDISKVLLISINLPVNWVYLATNWNLRIMFSQHYLPFWGWSTEHRKEGTEN